MTNGHRRGPVRPAILTAMALTFMTGGVAACGSDEPDQYAHCVDQRTGQVVDDDACDDNDSSGHFVYWMSSTHHQPGYRVPANSRYIGLRDSAARKAAGLPPTGKVSSGTKISGGGFGSGKSGSS